MLRPEDCKPGTLVECIDSSPGWSGDACGLRKGAVYTIEALEGPGHHGAYGIVVHEISPSTRRVGRFETRGAFNINRFRLLPESRLAVFRAMLAPIQIKELTDV